MEDLASYENTLEEAQKLLQGLGEKYLPNGELKFPPDSINNASQDEEKSIETEIPVLDDSSSEGPPELETYNDRIKEKKSDIITQSMNLLPQKKKKIGRNERCPCGSGKKYKKCCIDK